MTVIEKITYERHKTARIVIRLILPALIFICTLCILFGLYLFVINIDRQFVIGPWQVDEVAAVVFSSIFQGYIGTIFGIAGTLLIVLTFIYQVISNKKNQQEATFFKLIDYHRDNVNSISIKSYRDYRKKEYEAIQGKRAFVTYKLQIYDCLAVVKELDKKQQLTEEQIRDLAYMIIYYGIDKDWKEFTEKQFDRFPEKLINDFEKKRVDAFNRYGKNIGRTNQTILSSYYRNMYNAIKYIDESIYLSSKEKYQLIKLFRAQLSNSELAVFFFNIESFFGKKWKYIQKDNKWIKHNMIERYQLLKNLPSGYIRGFDHKHIYENEYEDDELNTDI